MKFRGQVEPRGSTWTADERSYCKWGL